MPCNIVFYGVQSWPQLSKSHCNMQNPKILAVISASRSVLLLSRISQLNSVRPGNLMQFILRHQSVDLLPLWGTLYLCCFIYLSFTSDLLFTLFTKTQTTLSLTPFTKPLRLLKTHIMPRCKSSMSCKKGALFVRRGYGIYFEVECTCTSRFIRLHTARASAISIAKITGV